MWRFKGFVPPAISKCMLLHKPILKKWLMIVKITSFVVLLGTYLNAFWLK